MVDVLHTGSGEVLAAGVRKVLLVQNIGANNIYLTFDGDTASSTTGFKLVAGGSIERSQQARPPDTGRPMQNQRCY